MKLPTHKWGIILGSAAFFAVAAFLTAGALRTSNAFADTTETETSSDPAQSFVTIFDSGEKTIVKSADMTVREILSAAEIPIDEGSDIIEPSLDQPISGRDYYVNIYRARPTLVTDGTRTVKLMTASTVPTDIATAAGISLHPEDVVKITTEGNFAATGIPFAYQVVRANLIKFLYYGTEVEARTQEPTIGAFLASRGITLSADDWLSRSLDAPVTNGISLQLSRNGKSTIVATESIPFTEQITYDYEEEQGHREVTQAGIPGEKSVTYEVEMYAGEEISRAQISEIITREPTPAAVTIGARSKVPATTPSENETISWRFFRSQGFSRHQTAGIMGNLMQEHRFSTTNTSGGCGIAQWLGGRRTALMSRPDWESIHTQLAFLMEELNSRYSAVKRNLLATDSVEEATRIFQDQFEKCGICREPNRIKYAYEILHRHEE